MAPTPGFTITIRFDYELNASLQVGDSVYWNPVSPMGIGFLGTNSNPYHFGHVTKIFNNNKKIQVLCPYWDTVQNQPMPNAIPPANSFISFSKNKVVNNNNLLGYYASVGFRNDSYIHTAELFSVGSEVSESSK